MDAEIQKKLREKFSDDVIGKLPRVTCPKCRDSRTKSCDEHQKTRCALPDGSCGGWMTPRHIHLSYVGHAAVTDRLLAVDPSWTWEPLAFGPDGLPQFDRHGGLWIRLTVAGVTRIGYGDADGKQGPDGVKGAVSDALRNGAMRFGVGLDLWHKDGELNHEADETAAPNNGQAARSQPAPGPTVAEARGELGAAMTNNGWDRDIVSRLYADKAGHSLAEATDPALIVKFREHLFTLPQADLMAPAPATSGAAQ